SSAELGTPEAIRQRIRSLRPRDWKYRISSATYCDETAKGEQITMRCFEARSDVLSSSVKTGPAATDSSSRKMGESLWECPATRGRSWRGTLCLLRASRHHRAIRRS